MSGQPRTYLAFDYGLKRVGVATGNSLMCQAQPLRTIAAEGDARFVQIGKITTNCAEVANSGVPIIFHQCNINGFFMYIETNKYANILHDSPPWFWLCAVVICLSTE